jgi:hypothetical protein
MSILPDDTKIAAASAFDSLKNYDNPSAGTAVFSGSIASFDSQLAFISFAINRSEGAIGNFLFNYSGSPNDSNSWLFGPGPLRWGGATFDGGWGGAPIKVVQSMTASLVSFELTLENNDIISHNIVDAVTVTIQPALFIAPFAS